MPVEILPSARGRAASQNLADFVRRARDDVAAFGAVLDFDGPAWDVTGSRTKRLSAGGRTERLYFTTAEGGELKGLEGRVALAEPFAGFIKATVRLREERKSKAANNHRVLIRAARYLYEILAAKGHDPCQLVASDFQAAAAACRQREMATSRYRIGLALIEIAGTMNRYGISKTPIDFKNPFPRTDEGTRIGREHERRRAEKLPSEAALDALAQIANLVTEPADIVRIRCIELLVCGGWRINEALTLPAACEVTELAFENGEPALDANGNQVERYGIRYFAEKDFGPTIKWIPTAMVDVAKRAISNIRSETDSARKVARWLETNPGRAFIPPEFGNQDLFTMQDIVQLFGLAGDKGAAQWVRARELPIVTLGRRSHVRRSDLEAALLAEQPVPTRGGLPLTLSEYLFVVPMNYFQERKATNPWILEFLTDGRIYDFLQGRESSRGRIASVFERFGFTEADGGPIELTSHMFRHWLNTLMQQGGMGQHEIARWSGRKDIGQNAAYDHVSAVELAEKARAMMERGQAQGFVAEVHDSLPPVDREKFREAQFTTGHTTDIGMCGTDWSLVPCLLHGACAGCGDHWIDKGNKKQCRRAEVMLDEHRWLLERAEAEAEEETYGASNYVEHNRRTVRGLERIIAVHNDPSIPDGTLVQVNPSSPSLYDGAPLDGPER